MRGNRFTTSLDPNEKNITFCLIAILSLWCDVFFPHFDYTGRLFTIESSPLYMESPLFTALFGWLQSWNFVSGILTLILFIGIGGLIIRFNGTFAYIKIRTILPAIIFSAIGSVLFSHSLTHGIVIASLLMCLLYAAFFFVETFNPLHAFNAGMLLAAMTLLSPCLVILVVPYLTFYHSTSALSGRSLLASLFGFIVPILYSAIYFVVVGEAEELVNFFLGSFKLFSINYAFSRMEIVYLTFLTLTSVLSIGSFILDNTHDNIKSRKQNTHIINLFVWVFALVVLGVPDAQNLIYALTLLWGLLLGRYFSVYSSRVAYVLFFLFFVISLLTFFID